MATSVSGLDASEMVKAEMGRRQEAYNAALQERMRQEATQASGSAEDKPSALSDLLPIPYIDGEGRLSDAGVGPGVKASVYAVLDAEGAVQYIGVSRNVMQSLWLQLGRMPSQTYAFKVHHITKPNRSLLEATRQAWIKELGAAPPGNDGDSLQALWEGPLDVKPLMTEADHQLIEAAREKNRPEENAMKKVAKRFENAKIEMLTSRGVTESLRFDPKLKGKGLLDLYITVDRPDSQGPPDGKP